MWRNCVLGLALVLGAAGGFASDAEARLATVRFTQPDATGVTAFRIYLRQEGQSYGAPAWQGLPTAVGGVYSAQITVADDVTVYATGTAINADGESALSNEIALAPPAPVCGNAALEPPEQCDDGNTASGDGCSATCATERIPACGDAILDAGEQCDDGNASAGDGCRADCTRELCGDARLDPAEGCDDGNTAGGDGCSATCTTERIPACGDAILDAGEQCDDGNAAAGDGCRADCTAEACGDGRVDPGETCDDGNTAAGDGCDAACHAEGPTCGDGVQGAGEECDDGNTATGDGCDALCRTELTSSVLPLYVNVGGPDYTDPAIRTWRADPPFTSDGTPSSDTTQGIAGTNADPIYQSRRYGDAAGPPVAFELPVEEEGLYFVRLHFAELGNEVSKAGQRVFDVLLDGAIRIEDVDVMKQVGKRQAATREATVYVSDGVITLELLPQVGRPMLSGVEVHRASEAPADVPSPKPPKIVGCGKSCR